MVEVIKYLKEIAMKPFLREKQKIEEKNFGC